MHKLNLIAVALLVVAIFACGPKTSKTSNGFEYTHVIANDGPKAGEEDKISFHMTVKTDNDSLLANSYQTGMEQQVVIPPAAANGGKPDPFLEIFKKMAVGDSVIFNMPVDSLPSKQGLPAGAKTLIYTFKMTKLVLKKDLEAARQKYIAEAERVNSETKNHAATLVKGTDPSIQKTASGIKYILHTKGTGSILNIGEKCKVMYFGMLTNGTEFDQSYKRGEPIEFPVGVGQVIKGWDEMLTTLPKGSKATVLIPYALGYGEAGAPPRIPAKSDLVFFIDMME